MSENKSLERRDKLIEEYRDYVQAIVGSMIQSMCLPARLFEEFEAAGYLGLVEAASRFDFNSGSEFKYFAFLRIRGAVIDSIRECADVSGAAYHRARAFQAAHEYREEQLKESVAAGGQAAGRDEALNTVYDAAAAGLLAFRLSVMDVEEEITDQSDAAADLEDEYNKKQQREKIKSFLATIPEKERLVLEEFYFKDKSFSDIAEEYGGMSRSWVCRLHAKAIEKLRAYLLAQGVASA